MDGRLPALAAPLAMIAIATARRSRRGSSARSPLDRFLAIVEAGLGAFPDEIPQELTRALDAEFRFLGVGGSRAVYRLDKETVAKLGDAVANEEEYDTWKRFGERMGSDDLVPVRGIYADGRVLVMDYARPVTQARAASPAVAARIDRARGRLDAIGLDSLDARFDFNWGWHHGKVKLLDYGSGPAD
jgi:hypothetical protein